MTIGFFEDTDVVVAAAVVGRVVIVQRREPAVWDFIAVDNDGPRWSECGFRRIVGQTEAALILGMLVMKCGNGMTVDDAAKMLPFGFEHFLKHLVMPTEWRPYWLESKSKITVYRAAR